MCAINGVTTNDRTLVERMNEATKHRGPDGSRVWEGNGVTFGHNRLAIIDLSDRALQPMHSGDGRYTIVFNGEIYNYRELRTELEHSYEFKTESDTEVLIAAYARWGESMFPRLRGMFAFGLWDTYTETLLLARDHMGIKPLYYAIEDGVLTFSSELTTFTEHFRTLDHNALAHYFTFQYVPSPDTLIKGVMKLRPGHLLSFTDGKATMKRYYAPEHGEGIPQVDHKEGRVSHETLRECIDGAVARQLVSDRPVGMFLSGGLDSSIVLHHMAKHAQDVRTFSVDFEMVAGAEHEANKFNADASLAEETARAYGAQHTTHRLPLSFIRAELEHVVGSLDEPVANPTAISQYFLSQRVREDGVVVALGGDGGDELFLGYTRHRMLMAAYEFQKLPHSFRTILGRTHSRIAKLNIPFGHEIHMAVMANKAKSIMPYLNMAEHPHASIIRLLDSRYREARNDRHPLATFMHVDRGIWLPDESLHRTDRTGMAHGLELRVPLIDLAVVTLADTIPVERKLTPFSGKRILRDAYREHLPAYLFTQPKRGWVSPGAKWLRDGEVLETVKAVLSPAYYDGLSELYNWESIQSLLTAHVEKKTYALYPLWNLFVLQVWARKFGVIA